MEKVSKIVAAFAFYLCSQQAFGLCSQAGACVDTEPSVPFATEPFEAPDAFKESWQDYRQWSRLTGFELSGLHWQQFIVIYANKSEKVFEKNHSEYIRYYIEEDDDDDTEFEAYEAGTVLIKENYLAQNGKVGQPLTLTTMIKHEPGFDPEHNDWEYIQSSVDGKVLLQGKFSDPTVQAVCAECHSNIAERDYIFSTFYSK